MEIILKSNIKEFVKYLDDVEKKHVPFATSLALNATAVEAQKAVVDAIPHIFNNRKKWWLKQQPTGVKVQFTTKGSKSKGIASNMKSRVYTDAKFAPRQEKGEIKKARGKNLAIPKKENVLDKFEKAGSAKLLMNDTKQYFMPIRLLPIATILSIYRSSIELLSTVRCQVKGCQAIFHVCRQHKIRCI